MKKMHLTKLAIAGSTVACAALFSFSWSEQRGVSMSVESAQARVGRPLTPMSVAGVARRQDRRAAYRYGAEVVGASVAGAAAVGGGYISQLGMGRRPLLHRRSSGSQRLLCGVHGQLQQWLVHNSYRHGLHIGDFGRRHQRFAVPLPVKHTRRPVKRASTSARQHTSDVMAP